MDRLSRRVFTREFSPDLSHVRLEARLRAIRRFRRLCWVGYRRLEEWVVCALIFPKPINKSLIASRGADIVMQSSAAPGLQVSSHGITQALAKMRG
jgi:hypothetical protein